MKKRFVAFLLVLIMVLGMLPVSAMAALDTGHMIDVTFTVLYVGEEFRMGYNYGTSEKTQFVCQYKTNHSDTAYNNHTIAISDIKAAANRATVNSGYQIVGWTKTAKADPTILDLNAPNATACNKGTTIYLVAKIPAPSTVTYILNYQPGTTDRVANMPGQQYEENNAGKATFTVSEKIPTRDGYTFKYWETNDHTRVGTTVEVTAANNPMNIYAVWEQKQHEHHDDDGDGFCDDDRTCMHPKDGKGNCTITGCTHPDTCCPKPEDPKPPKPDKPGDGDKPTVAVKIKCVQPQSVVKHNDSDNAMVTRIAGNSYTVNGDVREGEYKGKTRYYVYCTVTEPIQTFVDAFNIAHKGHTEANSPAHVRTFMLWYFPENKEKGEPVWQQDVTPTFYVKCEVTPPTDTYVVTYTDGVEDEVIFEDWVTTGLKYGDATPVLSKDPFRSGYTFAGWEPEVAKTVTKTVTYVAKWTPVEPKAPTADELEKLEMAVQVKCDVDKLQLHKDGYDLLGEYNKDYFVGEPRKVGDNWLCDISYLPDLYVTEFNKEFPNLKHVRNDEKLVPVTLIWDRGSWQVRTQGLVNVTEEYTVTFDAYGGSPTPDEQHVKSGEKAVPPAKPTLKGYTFAFWYLGEDEKNATAYNFDTPVTENITLTAKWEINKYKVTFDSNGGSKVDPRVVEYGLYAQEPEKPTLKGFTFAYWYLDDENKAYDFDTTPITEDITLTAKWEINKFKVTFDTDGGEPIPGDQFVEWGLFVEEPTTKPTKTGYTFDGWYLGDEKYDFSAAVEQNITLTAKWTQNTYTVTFDPNGGSVDPTSRTVTFDEPYGEMPVPTRTGYDFLGWFTAAEGGDQVTANTTVTATADHTLYAQWEAKKANVHLMIFKSGDLSKPIVDVPYTTDKLAGETLDLTALDPKTYLTFDFEIDGGWYDDGLFNLYKKYVNGEQANKPVALTELQINGNWQNLKLIVTELVPVVYFDSLESLTAYQNDHSKTEGILRTTKARVGSALPTADAPTATREGYTFTFWSREGQTVDVTDQTVNGWTNLYANWEANTYTVTFDANGGEGAMDAQTFTYDVEQALTANAFTRTGYTFKEWTTNADGTGTAYADKATVKNLATEGTVTLYAQWTPNKYTVKFDANKGTGTMADQEFTYDAEQALTANAFSRTGYTFKEWTTNADGTGDKYADKATVKNLATEGSVTLYAQWTANKYTVTFDANGGTAADPASMEVTFDAAYGTLATTSRKGYTFVGWFTAKDGGTEVESTTVVATADDHTLYAHWMPNTYNYEIHYYVQQPDGSYVEDASALDTTKSGTFDSTVTVTPDANKYGAHFSVNNTKSKLSGVVTVDTPAEILKLEVYYDRDFHTLTYLDSRNGSVIGTTTVRCGVSVAAPKDPTKAGYWFDGWYNAADNKKVTFPVTLTNNMTVYAGWTMIVLPSTIAKKTPKLNTADHFAYVQGYPDGTVKPAGNITRAETAAILFRLMDDTSRNNYYSTKSGFRDVAAGTWYNTYVATLNNAGVITDSANGYFRPNDAITRAELAAMLAAFTDTTRAANYFNDVTANYWAANAIAVCAKLGWINGYPDGSFRPDRNVTRAELMAMINRATGRAPKSADAFLPGMKTWSDNTADKWYYLDVQEATNSHSYTVRPTEIWTAITAAPNWSKYE